MTARNDVAARRLRTVLPALVAAGLVCPVPAPFRTWALP